MPTPDRDAIYDPDLGGPWCDEWDPVGHRMNVTDHRRCLAVPAWRAERRGRPGSVFVIDGADPPTVVIYGYAAGRYALEHAWPSWETLEPLVAAGVISRREQQVLDRNAASVFGAQLFKFFKPLRRVAAPANLAALDETLFGPVAREFVGRLGDRADLVADLTWQFPIHVIGRYLGIPGDEIEHGLGAHRAALQSVWLPAARYAADDEALNAYLYDLLARRRAHPTGDLASELALGRCTDPIDEVSFAALYRFFLTNACEALFMQTSSILWFLLHTPGVWERVAADPSLAEAAVAEGLRIEPTTAIIPRLARDGDLDICGVRVPQGTLIGVDAGGGNNDPAVFADPGRFNLDRDRSVPVLTFGGGMVTCLGRFFARRFLVTLIGELAVAAPRLRPDGDEVPHVCGTLFRSPYRLPARLD